MPTAGSSTGEKAKPVSTKGLSAEEKTKIKENVAKSPWRASYHIEPETGLLNDPNGFSYYNGKFQLFYQNWPFGAAHGLKQWSH